MPAYVRGTHIAHDCTIRDGITIGYSTGLARHVRVNGYTVLSASISVHQFCKIGKSTMIVVGSVINMNIVTCATAQGDMAVLAGLSLIGLKRQKIKLRSAYRIPFISKLMLEDAIAEPEDSM
jgi:UDP-N-acetylglucosamine acyltransferase